MKLQETSKEMGGIFNLRIYENADSYRKGIVKSEITEHNKMTNASLAAISGLIFNTGSQTAFSYLAVGTSTTAVSAAHTALQAEIVDSGLARASATPSRSTTTQANDTGVLTISWTVSGTKTIEEIGIFNAASSGVMLARALTTSKSVISGNIVQATYSWVAVGN